jgi:hypothetical protein
LLRFFSRLDATLFDQCQGAFAANQLFEEIAPLIE